MSKAHKILVVDDHESVAVSVQRAAPPGWEVEHASDGIAGLEVLRANPEGYGLVILDLFMPNLDGRAALVLLRGLDSTIPVRIFTGKPDQQATKLAYELTGAPPWIKPIPIPELARLIQEALDVPPVLRPSEGVLSYAQDLAWKAVQQVRAQQQTHIIVYASSKMDAGGVREMLIDVGIGTAIVVPTLEQLRLFVRDDTVIATTPNNCIELSGFELPMLYITTDWIEAIETYEKLQDINTAKPWSIIVESAKSGVRELIYTAIEHLSSGEMFIPMQMRHPFVDDKHLSEQERKLIKCEVRGMDTRDTATYMQISFDTVRKLRSRICEKLEVSDLRKWGNEWWLENYP